MRGVVAALLIGAAAFLQAAGARASSEEAQYIGADACSGCHQHQAAQWRDSHHAKAMQHAGGDTVLGDFNDKTLSHAGGGSRFFKRDGKYFIRTDGQDGKPATFEVRYTFGVYPLQQYLVELPGGKLQALATAWDARPKAQGGQRWFHLYPGQKLKAGDALHWTGRDQNWNFMCASCHSTNLQRNYDLASDSYKTTWSDINVACEACHGPGSRHAEWARGERKDAVAFRGFDKQLRTGNGLHWNFADAGQKIASTKPLPEVRGSDRNDEADTCFACHARRQELNSRDRPGQAFLDRYQPGLLERGQYHADGRIDGEVFEYGSFTQSKMYRAGVTCSNCHEPHALKLRADGNALCGQCHQAAHYERTEHHRHRAGSAGAECVNCHMPVKTYMGVDQRRDHGFKVPRPDIGERLQTPDACTQCHAGRSPQWTMTALNRWGIRPDDTQLRLSIAIDAAWTGSMRTESLLTPLAADSQLTDMQRATALSLLPTTRTPQTLAQIAYGLSSDAPLVRLGAARALGNLEPQLRTQLGLGLLGDPLRAIRVEAARALADAPRQRLTPAQRTALDSAMGEAVAAELVSAERPESHVNLAQLYQRAGRPGDAESELLTALRLAPGFVPAMVNLADLYRQQRREAEGEQMLHKAMMTDPTAASPVFALGLLKIRQNKRSEALALLKKAATLAPRDAQYAYALALALNDGGDNGKALEVIKAARRYVPEDGALLQLQISILHKLGSKEVSVLEAEFARLAAH
ncbi:hypothetical protein EGT07_08585 [Herbaspirillum sp. HC18]|nr:hypothetical protein EGT07_08585 [Herbaspirillum sp. HC18]